MICFSAGGVVACCALDGNILENHEPLLPGDAPFAPGDFFSSLGPLVASPGRGGMGFAAVVAVAGADAAFAGGVVEKPGEGGGEEAAVPLVWPFGLLAVPMSSGWVGWPSGGSRSPVFPLFELCRLNLSVED